MNTTLTVVHLAKAAAWCVGAALTIAPLMANSISLNFNSLPSTQGWNYSPNACGPCGPPPSETDVFSVDGTKLRMDSIGWSAAPQYLWAAALNHVPFDFQFQARLLEVDTAVVIDDFFFSAFVGIDDFFVYVGLGPGRVAVEENVGQAGTQIVPVDTSQFHTYRLLGDPDAGTYQFLVDGNQVLSRSIGHYAINSNFLAFGDRYVLGGNQPVGAVADLSFFQFNEVPEPATAALLAAGLFILGARRGVRS